MIQNSLSFYIISMFSILLENFGKESFIENWENILWHLTFFAI